MVLVLVSISIRDQFGEPWPKRGPSPKNRDFWDIKLKIFGNKEAENFEKFRGFKRIRYFCSFKGKFGHFREILGNFLKNITGHKTPNVENFQKFVNKNAIKRGR